MDKAGWQISTFIAGLALVGTTFGLVANKSALTQERNDKQPCPPPTVETRVITETQNLELPKNVMYWPDTVRCQGGRLLIKTEQGFESLTHNGAAMRCNQP
ncbi:hypothetical protein AB8807_11610 [Xanthomonas campestris pv. olitorii]|uniref:hypothetical protein n=1 Tax=Xanthomonas TaxID=338 RepID=UPI001C4695BA|nr:hypothetical protein [Xanthomonas euvesicatoria]MBV6871792.1 hypothetical protein [Xanthomonas campestris pv. veroniae]WVK02304.1 hypothetical protein KWH09_11575 [Xanthomonas campestris pv. olitorii]